jgi:hypothetical protein
MNRADLSWALNAVIPHTGRRTETTNRVGLAYRDGWSFAYATDRYTSAVARIPNGADVRLWLPTSEAVELERFVRPSYKDEYEDELVYARQPQELHIGIDRRIDREGTREEDTAVFETVDDGVELEYIFDFIHRLSLAPAEFDECIYQVDLAAKFAKAKRTGEDRLRILPRHTNDVYGAAVVTVGTDFVGAIAGLTYDQLGSATVADFLGAIVVPNTEREAA